MSVIAEWPADVDVRPIRPGDVGAWAELRAAAETVDEFGESFDADDLLEELGDPKLDLDTDTIGLWADGVMVAYGKIQWRSNVIGLHRVWSEATVHPAWRGRGLGSAMLPWLLGRATDVHGERHPGLEAELGTLVVSTNVDARRLLSEHGFQESRYFFTMRRLFDTPLPVVELPEGLRLVEFEWSYDDTLRTVQNAAFEDHWASTSLDEEVWHTSYTGSRGFRSELSRLILAEDKIVAFALGYEYPADTEVTGVREAYIGQVGTVPSHRHRGLAHAAMAALMIQAQQAGFERAALSVDSANSTGALGLYERLGFVQVKQHVRYARPLR